MENSLFPGMTRASAAQVTYTNEARLTGGPLMRR
jgi:hypothetical protein